MSGAASPYRRDGIPEIVSGLLWLLWGVAFLAPALRPDWPWDGLGGFALPALMLLGALGVRPATRALKARLAPAAAGGGGSAAGATGGSRAFTLLFAATLGAALVWVLLPGREFEWQRLIPVVLGILLAVIHAFVSWRHHLARYRLLALYILAAGALLSSIGITPALAFSLFLILLGIGSTAAGYAALRGSAIR